MKSEGLTDAEIRAIGWEALIEKLGPAGALRFAMQTEHGYGDYSELRHRLLGSLSVDELLEQTKARRRPARRRAASQRR